ncbi:MAG TPA: hypothetical protein PLE72_05135 [Azospira sp.]|nr:hypothetical protein [Azospira sp.]HNN46131.1 hypothetical protein [Azospira sp.]
MDSVQGVGAAEAPVGVRQFVGMRDMAMLQRDLDIVEHHDVQAGNAIVGLEQFAAHFGGNDGGNVFMFGDGLDFFSREIAKVQTVFKAKHGRSPDAIYWISPAL